MVASTGRAQLAPDFKVALAPVREAAQAATGPRQMPYVMGDDPEHMNAGAVVAARALQRPLIRAAEPVAGYLYLVAQQPSRPGGRLALFRSQLAGPALAA
ncbi:MAG: hypothetical protein Q7N95_06610, partial [Alphaproteobacteria bacterium]|nr:hypothetical protein [Alphaproteobacteria bacterium]